MMMENVPADIVPLIFEHLTDRRDLYNCVQLNKAFHRAATPLLYKNIDSRIAKRRNRYERVRVLHPSETLLQQEGYAKYVRHVSETAAVGFHMPQLMPDCLKALSLCTNLQSFSWTDDIADSTTHSDAHLLAFLDVLVTLPVQALTIHTYLGLSERAWLRLQDLRGLRSVAIWCMEGPPRILQGWSERLGATLTHLELGRCAGVPASILVSVLAHLTHLRSLRLKGAPSGAILEALALLPALTTLDTEYLGHGRSKYEDEPRAALRALTVRTSSVDVLGPEQLWPWIRRLVPRPSLEALTLNSFSTQGEVCVPRRFLLDLAQTQGSTLRALTVQSAQMTVEDIECVCTLFPRLELLVCSGWSNQPDPIHVEDAIANAHNLRELRLHTSWVPTRQGPAETSLSFGPENARNMMLREGSQLRVVAVGRVLYTGRWVIAMGENGCSELQLEITSDVVRDKWI